MNLNDWSIINFRNWANELETISLQVSSFANEPWKENFLGIDFPQID